MLSERFTMFEIPVSLEYFTAGHINDLLKQAKDEIAALRASVNKEAVTEEQLDRLEELQTFIRETVPTHCSAQTHRRDRFSALNSDPEPEPEPDGEEEP